MRAAVLASLLVLPLTVAAQVYTWKDASGKVHYTDQPPADRGVQTRRLGPDNYSPEENEAARKAAADKRLDANKRSKDSAEQAAKAEKERAADEQRRQDCERARVAVQGIESGQIRFRMSASGEREALEEGTRDAELATARRIMESNCGPKPAAPTAAPAKKPGY
jgi:hypothetical protein